METEIEKIRKAIKEFTIEFLRKNIKFDFLNDEIDQFALKLSFLEPLSQYQWMCIHQINSIRVERCILSHYLYRFIKRIQIITNKNNIQFDSLTFNEKFNDNFKKLEDEVLLSKRWEYLIIIPTFQVKFPKNIAINDYVEFDENFIIRRVDEKENPYIGGMFQNFFKIPEFWDYFDLPPNASVEIKFHFEKRLNNQPIYDEDDFIPQHLHKFNAEFKPIEEKIFSVYDFFNIFRKNTKYRSSISFGFQYFIRFPAFSLDYTYLDQFLMHKFPRPYSSLNLITDNEILKKNWKENYEKFFNSYYTYSDNQDFQIFRYVLEVQRQLKLFYYPPIQCFLLVSSFESLFLDKKTKKLLSKKGLLNEEEKKGYKYTATRAFLKLSEHEKMKWEYFFYEPETKSIDLGNFIITSFNYRNSIAHPAKPENFKYFPEGLFQELYIKNKNMLQRKIIEYFPEFQVFCLEIWIRKNIKDIKEWHKYIRSLF